MFGFTTISIDAKGRLAIPAKYRNQLLSQNEDSIVVTRDPQYPALKKGIELLEGILDVGYSIEERNKK